MKGLVAVAVLLTASCAPAYKARFDMTSSQGIVWPGKPEKPRIVYLWSLQNVAGEQNKGGLLSAAAGEEEVTDPQMSPVLLRPQGVYADEERLYVADPGAARVTVIDRKTMAVIQIFQTDTGGLAYPLSVVASRDGTIFVSDADLGKVIAYSSSGKFMGYFEGELQRPAGLAIDRQRGIVYVVDTMGHTVYKYGTDGKRL
ncbi:MAG: hypothetical protein M0Z60_14605, partial [Nitrospiraceae bacterium]|nr:hypothetical protein [Nitrospiraceae bacterium]